MTINKQKSSSIACFALSMRVKHSLEPLQTQSIATPAIGRGCKVGFLTLFEVLNPRILKIMRIAFVNKGRWKGCSISRNAGKQADELATAILTGMSDPALFESISSHDTLCRACQAYEKAFLIPVVKVFSCNVVFFDAIDKLYGD
jgi:hypothetical protein